MGQLDESERASRTEIATYGSPLPRGDSVQKREEMAIAILRAAQTFLQNYLDLILATVLLLAGALKERQLLTDPFAGRASGFPRELLIGSSAFELAFGSWLLAGLYRPLTRWLALAWFANLAAVTLAQAVGGVPSCACFGALQTSPWLLFAFDVAAVAALLMWSPCGHVSRWRFLAALCLSLSPAALFGLDGSPRAQTMFAEIDLGEMPQARQKQHAFQLRNYSGAFVEVAAVETSCPCASIRLERTGIPAGQSLAGAVRLNMGREPDFVGDLAIKATGLTRQGQVAFVLLAWVRVCKSSKAA